MMFNDVPNENIGLEWEPTHQLEQLIDPIPQLRQWVKKIVHVYGKDATIDMDAVNNTDIRVSNLLHSYGFFKNEQTENVLELTLENVSLDFITPKGIALKEIGEVRQ